MVHLDYPEFFLLDMRGLKLILNASIAALKNVRMFPVKEALWRKWNNVRGQLSFFRQALQMPAQIFNFSWYSSQPVITAEDIAQSGHGGSAMLNTLTSSTWNAQELVTILAALAGTEFADEVRLVLEPAAKQCPELLAIALASVPESNPVAQDLCVRLTFAFIMGHPSSSYVLQRLWRIDEQLVPRAMLTLYQQDKKLLSRILDVAQELKVISFQCRVSIPN